MPGNEQSAGYAFSQSQPPRLRNRNYHHSAEGETGAQNTRTGEAEDAGVSEVERGGNGVAFIKTR